MHIKNQMETSFPRGGVIKQTPIVKPQQLKKKKKRNMKKAQRDSVEQLCQLKQDKVVEPLTWKVLKTGLLVLGKVQTIAADGVFISLPGKLSGFAPIKNRTRKNLLNYFYVGQNLVVKIVDIVQMHDKVKVTLTLDPKQLHSHLMHTDIISGMVMTAAVASMEDQGYKVDFGIENVFGFLPFEAADKYEETINGGRRLDIGQLLHCLVLDDAHQKNSVVPVTAEPSEVNAAQVPQHCNIDKHTVLPGMTFSVEYQKACSNGICVTWHGRHTGYIHRDHLQHPCSDLQTPDHMQFKATVLYTTPVTGHTYFKVHTVPFPVHRDDSLCKTGVPSDCPVKLGQICHSAKVIHASWSGISIALTENGLHGFVAKYFVSDSKHSIQSDLQKEFPPGTRLTCRTMYFSLMDNKFMCTMKKTMLDDEIFTIDDVHVGQKVVCTVTAILADSLIVQIGTNSSLKALVPSKHYSDNSGNKPASVFKTGQVVQGRVYHVSEDSKIFVTLRKEFLSMQAKILMSEENIKPGSWFHGMIERAEPSFLLVSFFNQIKGSLSIEEIPFEKRNMLQVGSIVLCRVVGHNVFQSKVMLSMMPVYSQQDIKRLEKCEGTVLQVSKEGIDFKLNKYENIVGHIPLHQVSPHVDLNEALSKCFNAGQKIEAWCIMPPDTFRSTPIFTMDKTMVDTLRLVEPTEASVNLTMNGYVKSISDSYVTLNLCVVGDNHTAHINVIPEELEKYNPGQSLICKITSMMTILSNYTPGVQATLSLESNETLDVKLSCKLLEDYLRKIHINKKLDKLQGKSMNATVEHVSTDGAVLRFKNGVLGKLNRYHMGKSILHDGMEVQALVLHTNSLLNECDVTLRPDIINAVSNKIEQDFEVETFYHGSVVIATDNFVLVKVKGHLVYIPSRTSGYGYLFSRPSELEGRRMKICLTKNHGWISEFNERDENREVPEKSSMSNQFKCNEKKKSHKKITDTQRETGSAKDNTEKRKSKRKADETFGKKSDTNSVLEQPESHTPRKRTSNKTANEASCVEPETVLEQPRKSKRKADQTCEQPMKVVKTMEQSNEVTQKKKSSIGAQEHSKQVKKLDQSLIPLFDTHSATKKGIDLKKEEVYCRDQFTWTCSAAAADTSNEDVFLIQKKIMTSAEKVKLTEENLGYKENESGNMEPTTPKDYDRLLFSKKKSSKLWIQYIAHHLKASEVDKARAVADRALEAIDMREDTERLNIWRTLVNIEGKYGDEDSLEKVMQRAAQYCDDFRVFIHALDTLKMTNRWQEAERVVEKLMKKFTSIPQTWMHIGDFYYHSEQHNKAEELLGKAFTSLVEEQYVSVALHHASLAEKYGSRSSQGAASILEMLKTNYPKRLDILFQYVDLLLRQDNWSCAITHLENAAKLKLSKKGQEAVSKRLGEMKQKYNVEEVAQTDEDLHVSSF